jgi:hypothetical protein
MRVAILCLFLTGCVVADVRYEYGMINGKIEPISCHGNWSSLFHSLEAGQFQICHASADLLGSKTSEKLPSLAEVLEAAKTLGAVGVKP